MIGRPVIHSKLFILDSAIVVANTVGYERVTYALLAAACKCPVGTVVKHYPTIKKLRRAIMSAAIARRDCKILAQGLAAGDSKAKAAPEKLKRLAVEGLL